MIALTMSQQDSQYEHLEPDVVARIRRKLADGKSAGDIADEEEISFYRVYRIKVGETYQNAQPAPVTLDSLGLQSCDGKLCRKCGEPMKVKTIDGTCLECKAILLSKEGRLVIAR